MFGDSLVDRSVHGKQRFLGTPIELLDVVSAEWIDHSSNRSRSTSTRVIEVKHALDGTGLEAVHKRTSRVVERKIIRSLLHGSGVKMNDLVLRLGASTTGLDRTDGDGLRSGSLLSRGVWGGRGEGSLGNVDAVTCLDSQSQGNDLSDMSFGTINLDRNTERLAQQTHSLETLLVVGTTTTDVDFDLVIDKRSLELRKGTDDTLESSGNVGEVGDTTANDQDLSIRVRFSSGNKVENGFGVFVGLALSRCTGVFSVVGKFMGETVGSNSIRVND